MNWPHEDVELTPAQLCARAMWLAYGYGAERCVKKLVTRDLLTLSDRFKRPAQTEDVLAIIRRIPPGRSYATTEQALAIFAEALQ